MLITGLQCVVEDFHTAGRPGRGANPGLPVAIIGHSMGGMIAARYAQLTRQRAGRIVLSGPVLGTCEAVAALLGVADIPVRPDRPVHALSRDSEESGGLSEDPLVWHGPFKRQTCTAIAERLTELAIEAGQVTTRALAARGGGPAGSLWPGHRPGSALMRNGRTDRRNDPGARHEIFNEINKDEVLDDTTAFLAKVTDG